ncbi:putative xyloglucan:xyloglucosyl transferase, Xyloglucan-specific endo-beta-1,4-glucanase [Medicago truncatula]|uniref:Xyloglucan endotransglucosylase/hydrolase n=1 Tax=Medicago truncatula TaxID=3880 RepID=G7J5L1_MEDTR|nr:xyloglucan endotransglucosylase/hydrolase 2 [Medicago truncatula]AES72365.1 xyloglucan endotransglucosylase/hydrolase family protein [Medicago truncatula]RHN66887.1 putative xyloglucan:xyloglucosyl transferase, Xyloglucan-specific endo-beta-1,4-glucanase [Medicago truncatula]
MASSSYYGSLFLLLLSLFLWFSTNVLGGNFNTLFDNLFGEERVDIKEDGNSMTLTLDEYCGSGIVSKNEYLFGRFDMKIKLVPGNSAGTVTAYYLSSVGAQHDEIDIEFLGNLTGEPYLLSTNVYAEGIGGREMQFYLWFDPTEDYHMYSIDWNPERIIILVDNNPIRVMLNRQRIGVPFPTKRPMRVYTTLWNGDSWATRWGEVKIDLTNAPFVAGFKNFNAIACIANQGQTANCRNYNGGKYKGLDRESKRKMKQVLSKWVVYDYCADLRRYAHGLPYECRKENRIQLD